MKDITKLKQEVKDNFPGLNLYQLWSIVKIAKHVRLRCRNNTAFNNFMNELFPQAKFRTVEKARNDNSTYPGLSITMGDTTSIEEETED